MRVLLNISRVTMLLILVGALVVTAASAALVLFIPTISLSAFENTTDALVGEADWLGRVEKKLENNGYDADVFLRFPTKFTGLLSSVYVTSNIKGYGSGEKATADIDLTFGSKDVKHTFGVYYDNETVALSGFDKNENDKAILILRNNIIEALEGSVFHPDSGSKYAIDRETYDKLCDAIEDSDVSIEEELDEVTEAILKRSAALVETESGYRFCEGEFKLEKFVKSSLTYEDVRAIIDITVEELKNNSFFKTSFENAEVDIDEYAEKLKKSYDEGKIVIYYVIKDNKISEFELLDEKQHIGYLEETKITASFEYGKDRCVAIINGNHHSKEGYDFFDDKFEIRYEKQTNDSVDEIFIDFAVNTHNKEEQTGNIVLTYNKDKSEYLVELVIPLGEIEKHFSVFGSFEKYENNKGFYVSLKDYTVDGQTMLNLDSDVFSLTLKEDRTAKRITPPEGKALLSMTEEEIDSLLDNLPTENLAEIYEAIIGKDVPETEDGFQIFNPLVNQEAYALAQAYASYLRSTSSSDRVTKAYYYLEVYDIYVLLNYTGISNNVTIKLYKSPGDLIDSCHVLSIIDGIPMEHQYEVISEVASTCTSNGSITEKCIICNKQKTTRIDRLPHQYEVVSEVFADCVTDGRITEECRVCNIKQTYTTDSSLGHLEGTVTINKSDNPDMLCDATITTCLRCDMFLSVAYGDSVCWYFNGGNNAYPSYDTQHFILPDQIIDYIDISTIQINLSNVDDHLLSVRVPNGCEVIKYQTFSAAHNLQIVVIPASVTEIEDGAFSTEPPSTIYYLGTEDEWAEVELNGYESIWSDARVIFLPDGIEDATIVAECVDTSKAENLLNEKKTLTESIDAAELLAENNESVSVIYTDRVELVAYDKLTDTLSIAEVGESSTTITLMSSDGQIKGTFEVADVISIMDSDNGLLAMGSSSLGIIYLYDIEKGESSTFTFEKYECTFDHLYVDGDRVLFIADHKYSTGEYLYSFIPGGDCAKNGIFTIGHEKYYFLREYHTLISTDHINSQIILYNTADGSKIESTRGMEIYKNCLFSNGYIYAYYYYGNGFTDSKYAYIDHNLNETATRPESIWCELDIGYDSIEIQPIFASGNGRASMILDVDGNISVALVGEGADTTVIDYYAEAGFATSDGDIILYTPGGYGMVLVNTK